MDQTKSYEIGTLEGKARIKKTPFTLAKSDFIDGLVAYASIWWVLGWLDIKQRYRRSALGPFWLTISTAIMVGALGFVYSGLFGQPMAQYLPYLAVGLIIWTLISSLINESCTVFVAAEGMIKQVRLPLTVHVARMVWRNMIIFCHNAVILVLVYLVYGKGLHLDLLSLPVAMALIALNGIWIGLVVGIFCTRFRDIAQIVANIVQLTFFITPIFWRPEALHDKAWLVTFNPVFHFIELMRAPILGAPLPTTSWLVSICVTALGTLIALAILTRFRHRVPYWV
jgi:lipopolysaccharide transport system permease protein